MVGEIEEDMKFAIGWVSRGIDKYQNTLYRFDPEATIAYEDKIKEVYKPK